MRISSLLQTLVATALAIASVDATPCVTVSVKNNSPIQDGKIVTATVKLHESFASNPPSEVEISAPGLQFGRTKFKFDKNDRSSYEQVVTCRTESGSAPSKDGAVINVPVTLTYKQGPVAKETQNVQRQVVSSGRCSGWGDPHLTTLDGVAYDFQKPGVFQFFTSNNFQVQIFQEKCGPVAKLKDAAPSCYQGVAVAFGASVARFFIADGKIQVGKGSASLQWLSVEKLGSAAADGYRIFTNVDQGTYVDINLGKWAEYKDYPYLNVALQVSPYFKNSGVGGLMGNWNGNKNDDLTNNDKLAALYGVSLTNNLFTCVGDACSSMLQAGTIDDSNAMSLPTEQSLVHQGYVAVAADAITLRAFSPALKTLALRRLDEYVAGQVELQEDGNQANNNSTTAVPVEVDVTQRATELCRQVISSISTCAAYVRNTDFFVTNVCAADAVLLGDLSVIDSSKLAYLRDCRRELDARLESEIAGKTETNKLIADRAALLFGDLSRCAKDCSGRGECLAAGCKCNAGFTGHGCDITI